MPPTDIPVTVSTGHELTAEGTIIEMADADVANGNRFKATDLCVLFAFNKQSAIGKVPVKSTPSPKHHRLGDAVVSLSARQHWVKALTRPGWEDAEGVINVQSDDPDVELGVVVIR